MDVQDCLLFLATCVLLVLGEEYEKRREPDTDVRNAGVRNAAYLWRTPRNMAQISANSSRIQKEWAVKDSDMVMGGSVGLLLRDLAGKYLSDCHIVAVQAGPSSHAFTNIIRGLGGVSQGVVVVKWEVEASSLTSPYSLLFTHLREGAEAHFTCRAIILHITGTSWQHATRFLERASVWVWPGIRIVGVGSHLFAHPFLSHPVVANTAHAFYLATKPAPGQRIKSEINKRTGVDKTAEVDIVKKCHFCDGGESGTNILDTWHSQTSFTSDTDLLHDEFVDCKGHQFSVVSMDWFPFLSFIRHPGLLTVTPVDSLDFRMLQAVARIMNFTYEIKMPEDEQWGRQDNGNWTGTVGTLQRQKADFSMLLNWSYERRRVIDFTRIYAAEPLVIVSGRPRPRPRYLALVAPFTGMVWACMGVMVLGVGVVYWVLAWARQWVCEVQGQSVSMGAALLHVSVLLLGDTPFKMPSAFTTQMLLGWWCMVGLLVTATYRSSLIAHLSVPSLGMPVDRFEDLLSSQAQWTWGLEPTYGAEWEWFKSSPSSILQRIFKGIEVLETEEHLRRVLDGQHALLTWEYYIRSIVASRFTDARGYTPLHTSRHKYYVSTGYGWGFRKGAPFLERIDLVIQRLVETGLVNLWLSDLIADAAREARMQRVDRGQGDDQQDNQMVDDDSVVLSLNHLQGAFFILLLGCLISILAFTLEVGRMTLTSWVK